MRWMLPILQSETWPQQSELASTIAACKPSDSEVPVLISGSICWCLFSQNSVDSAYTLLCLALGDDFTSKIINHLQNLGNRIGRMARSRHGRHDQYCCVHLHC